MTLLSAVPTAPDTGADRFLAEQADLTAVERFAVRHEAEIHPRQARYYRDLIPLDQPQPGQQYAFEVDLDACTGCKACVTACHSLNGLDDGESWRSVSLLTGGSAALPFQQTVTSACHHCLEPACLAGCPVDAYEKDPLTGIVFHLDDQCIGCNYCTLTCPYEVPVYSRARGIVRKCDMCRGRLSAGEAPACVQACPNEAIVIKVVDIATVKATGSGTIVGGAPPSAITGPTTTYVTAKESVAAVTVAAPPPLARSHPPLAIMLVLTQLSVGTFVTDLVLRQLNNGAPSLAPVADAVVALAAGILALAASVFHLGRPRYFYRAVIGFRHSWLSREVVAFGGFTGLAVAYAVDLWLAPRRGGPPVVLLGSAVAAAGAVGVVCSVLIYTTTHRASWRLPTVMAKFALTCAVGGLAAVVWASSVSASVGETTSVHPGSLLPLVLAGVMALKLGIEAACMGPVHPRVRAITVGRFISGAAAGVALPLVLAGVGSGRGWLGAGVATVVLGGVVAGELLERHLFFTTASAPR